MQYAVYAALVSYIGLFTLLTKVFERLNVIVPADSPLLTVADPGPLSVTAAHVASGVAPRLGVPATRPSTH